MAIDIKRHKEKMNRDEPEIKLVPFIDILFTLLIFLVVTSTFGAASVTGDDTGTGTGKPNMTDTTGDAEYYLLPVAGLQKVVVVNAAGNIPDRIVPRHVHKIRFAVKPDLIPRMVEPKGI